MKGLLVEDKELRYTDSNHRYLADDLAGNLFPQSHQGTVDRRGKASRLNPILVLTRIR